MIVKNKSIRIINFAIDIVIIAILSAIVATIVGLNPDSKAMLALCCFLYYLVCESTAGKTLGKVVTKTVVVAADETKPRFLNILLRTILRFNPFDALSYLFGFEIGAHDQFSKTRLKFQEE